MGKCPNVQGKTYTMYLLTDNKFQQNTDYIMKRPDEISSFLLWQSKLRKHAFNPKYESFYSPILRDVFHSLRLGGICTTFVDNEPNKVITNPIEYQILDFNLCYATIWKSMTEMPYVNITTVPEPF